MRRHARHLQPLLRPLLARSPPPHGGERLGGPLRLRPKARGSRHLRGRQARTPGGRTTRGLRRLGTVFGPPLGPLAPGRTTLRSLQRHRIHLELRRAAHHGPIPLQQVPPTRPPIHGPPLRQNAPCLLPTQGYLQETTRRRLQNSVRHPRGALRLVGPRLFEGHRRLVAEQGLRLAGPDRRIQGGTRQARVELPHLDAAAHLSVSGLGKNLGPTQRPAANGAGGRLCLRPTHLGRGHPGGRERRNTREGSHRRLRTKPVLRPLPRERGQGNRPHGAALVSESTGKQGPVPPFLRLRAADQARRQQETGLDDRIGPKIGNPPRDPVEPTGVLHGSRRPRDCHRSDLGQVLRGTRDTTRPQVHPALCRQAGDDRIQILCQQPVRRWLVVRCLQRPGARILRRVRNDQRFRPGPPQVFRYFRQPRPQEGRHGVHQLLVHHQVEQGFRTAQLVRVEHLPGVHQPGRRNLQGLFLRPGRRSQVLPRDGRQQGLHHQQLRDRSHRCVSVRPGHRLVPGRLDGKPGAGGPHQEDLDQGRSLLETPGRSHGLSDPQVQRIGAVRGTVHP
mmetsp:Transcript_16290/g.35376  ORF Transcript_16290/g.35376 Transcript_16290/m.35376 type:complete len:561 (-) Transcript_16290:587-2269(-)